jgi:hypothetical protein
METVHIQLSYERRNVGVFKILSEAKSASRAAIWLSGRVSTYDRTFEKSAEGDMTKLSALADHDIKC